MTRRCSHCSHNGHNSRTCPNRGVKIFGVRISDGSIRKSASMGNLSHYAAAAGGGGSPADGTENGGRAADGYMSEDLVQGSSSSRERKKGVPWTEEEHKMFLLGLQKLGKGDWRGIARNYVVTRTPTQVASHAQKYFIRQTNASRRKRRTSLFDMVPDEHVDAFLSPMCFQEPEMQASNHHTLPPPAPAPAPVALEEECESMNSNSNDNEAAVPNPETPQCSYPVLVPAFVPPFFPLSFPFWPGYCTNAVENKAHEIFKPTASKAAIMIDELGGMSKLSLGESSTSKRPSFLSPKLPDGSDRQSAFHANPPKGGSSNNAIPAV